MSESKRQKFRRVLEYLQKETAHPYRKPLQGSQLSFKKLLVRLFFFLIFLVVLFTLLELFVPQPTS